MPGDFDPEDTPVREPRPEQNLTRLKAQTWAQAPAANLDIANLSPRVNDEIANNSSGRTTNKGMEGLAITPDGKTLVGFMQAALLQDAPTASKLVRIVPSGKRLIGLAKNVEYKALAADGHTSHGLSPVLSILDELGQVREAVKDCETAIGLRPCDPGNYTNKLLFMLADPAVDAATVARFEGELASMPGFVSTIKAWQLSRVETSTGSSAWTHVFEQEFTDVDGLLGPYLMHPIHWTVVDRWFDPETTDVIVRDRLCHSFCELPAPVL